MKMGGICFGESNGTRIDSIRFNEISSDSGLMAVETE